MSCVLCTQCCNFLWIVHSWLPLRLFVSCLEASYIDPQLFASGLMPYLWWLCIMVSNASSLDEELDECFVRGRNRLTFASTWGHFRYLVGSLLPIFLVFCVVFFVVVFILCLVCLIVCLLYPMLCLVYPMLCLVYPLLSLSMYCPFLIAPSVFYNFLLMWASFIDRENTTFTKLLLLFVSYLKAFYVSLHV
jgi:hypothetical protein